MFVNGHLNWVGTIFRVTHSLAGRTRGGKPPGQYLDGQDTIREAVQLVCVNRLVHLGLRWHVHCTAWCLGEAGGVLLTAQQLAHAKVCNFGSPVPGQEDVVAGEVSMDDAIEVEVCQG